MVVFTPTEELEMEEKAVRDFFREEWVEEPCLTMLTVGLVVVVVLMEIGAAVEAAEGTPVEAVETIDGIPVQEGEDLSTMEQISKTNVVTTQPAMVT